MYCRVLIAYNENNICTNVCRGSKIISVRMCIEDRKDICGTSGLFIKIGFKFLYFGVLLISVN